MRARQESSTDMFQKPTMAQESLSAPPLSTKQMNREGNTTKRHFVLVHGACHGAWCWYKVLALLKAAGHKVTALDMAASGVNPKKVEDLRTLSDYFEPLMEFMASLPQEEKVILVAHSAGGLGISMAMEKFPEKISVAVFVVAAMPGPLLPHLTITDRFTRSGNPCMDNQIVIGPPVALLLGPEYMSVRYYYHSPPEDLELATTLVRFFPMVLPALGDIILTKANYGSVSRVFILGDENNQEIMKWMIEINPPDEVKDIPGSDHMVMFSKPQELSFSLEEIGNKYL